MRRLNLLANMLVGLGNDVLSFGKDFAEGQPRLITTLMNESGLRGPDALERLIRMHDRAVEEFDELAASLGSWGAEANALIARWLQDVRQASLGFSLWEARAPRYTAHKLVAGGRVIEPTFRFVPSGS